MMIDKNKVKLCVSIFTTAVILLTLCAFTGCSFVTDMQKTFDAMSMTFSGVELSRIEDGTYTGECDAGLVFVKVQVIVSGGRLADITLLEHRNGLGSAAESIPGTMVARQTTDVDWVTGATVSSKAIRKAVENALLRM